MQAAFPLYPSALNRMRLPRAYAEPQGRRI